MRIVLVNHYAGSPRYGMEFRPYFLAREWVRAGHRVVIVAASQSHVRNLQPDVRDIETIEHIDGIEYRWLRTPTYGGNGLGRMRNMVTFLMRLPGALRRIEREGPIDAVIASSTYPLDYRACERCAERTGAALLFEVHDLWPLSPMELGGYGKGHPFIRLLQRAEDRYCRTADRVVSILPKTLEHLRGRGLDPARFRYLPNGISDDGSVAMNGAAPSWVQSERATGRFVIGYAGGMAKQNSVDTLIAAAERLRDEPFSLYLLGDGWLLPELQQRASAAALAHVQFAGRVPRAQALQALRACDAIWVGLANEPLYRFGIGLNKIFDAMLTARPVIASYTAGNDPIGEAGCGITVPADDDGALADACRRMRAMDPRDRAELGESGRRFVRQHHDYSVIANRFVDVIEEARADPNPHRRRGAVR